MAAREEARRRRSREERHAEAEHEAKRILERAARDSETVGTSSFARTASRVSAHFRADDGGEDRIEVLGKRIGRGLSLVAFVALAIYLVFTYVLK